jgi:hypothetical protein
LTLGSDDEVQLTNPQLMLPASGTRPEADCPRVDTILDGVQALIDRTSGG